MSFHESVYAGLTIKTYVSIRALDVQACGSNEKWQLYLETLASTACNVARI
jgi:hypothetical protein